MIQPLKSFSLFLFASFTLSNLLLNQVAQAAAPPFELSRALNHCEEHQRQMTVPRELNGSLNMIVEKKGLFKGARQINIGSVTWSEQGLVSIGFDDAEANIIFEALAKYPQTCYAQIQISSREIHLIIRLATDRAGHRNFTYKFTVDAQGRAQVNQWIDSVTWVGPLPVVKKTLAAKDIQLVRTSR